MLLSLALGHNARLSASSPPFTFRTPTLCVEGVWFLLMAGEQTGGDKIKYQLGNHSHKTSIFILEFGLQSDVKQTLATFSWALKCSYRNLLVVSGDSVYSRLAPK